MKLLVVGASGYLGAEIAARALAAPGQYIPGTKQRVPGTYPLLDGSGRPVPPGYEGVLGVYQRVVGTYHRAAGDVAGVDWRRLDVRDGEAVHELVREVAPDAVVNCAYRSDDWAATADGAGHVAFAAAEAGARLVHLSTDALHGGRPAPYGDDEAPTPIHPYGAAKAAAETAVRLVHPAAALVRTSLIVGDERAKQVRLCLDALSGAPGVALFADEIRCPISVDDLAPAVLELLASAYTGTINVAGPEAVSRVELGLLVARRYGLDPAALRSTTTAEAGLVRPAEIRLNSARAAGLLRTPLRAVSEALAG